MRGFVHTRWGRLSYCSAGPSEPADPARPAIVLLHDPEFSHTAFSPLVPLLSQHFHVVTLDAPGAVPCSAPSPGPAAEAFAEALDALGLDQVVLYGVRTGGRVAIQLSGLARRPAVAGLILSGVQVDLDEARSALGSASAPVLLLSNPLDPLFGADRWLARAIPRARQVIVRTGRLPVYWRRPDVVAQEITTVALGGRELPVLSPADFI